MHHEIFDRRVKYRPVQPIGCNTNECGNYNPAQYFSGVSRIG
jgi:hypothetical protein